MPARLDSPLARRYLEVVKQVVIGDRPMVPHPRRTGEMPGAEGAHEFGDELTMVGLPRLENVEKCVLDVAARDVPGDFVECGVWRGGTVVYMRALLAALGDRSRKVWVADSFRGLPPPGPNDDGLTLTADVWPELAVSRERVESAFAFFDLLDDQVEFLEGWFSETLPSAPIGPIAILRLDGDLYDSTRQPLEELYDRVSPGGYVIVDDYGFVRQARRAVDEFRAERRITEPIERIDWTGVFWRKGDEDRSRRAVSASARAGLVRSSPLVIVGVGGSGSRAVARTVAELGWFLAPNRNDSEDAVDVAPFDYRWIPPYLAGVADLEEMRLDFERNVLPRLLPAGRWGWKHCPSIHLLPFYAECFPDLKVVHVLRDGRDVVFGGLGTRTHTNRLGPAVIENDPRPCDESHPGWETSPWDDGAPGRIQRTAELWARTNLAGADFGENTLGSRYLRIRLEDLVEDPRATVRRLAAFLDVPPRPEAEAIAQRPDSLGGGKGRDLGGALPAMEAALRRFDYI